MGDNEMVCQLPGCRVTQKDVETALAEYLEGYCMKCARKRDGSLCGCPFPCSLTFKGKMLEKIHQLIGKEIPLGAKSIQVCFKHPELLRLARDASLATKTKDGHDGHQDLDKAKGLRTVKIGDDSSVVNLSSSILGHSKLRVDMPEEMSLLPDVQDHREFLQQIDRSTDLLEPREVSEGMTGLVFTDERGHEQGVLGKLVYTTDESGSSNMILQELGEEAGMGKSGRLMKIELSDMPGFVLDPSDIDTGGGDAVQSPLSPKRDSGLLVSEESEPETRKLLEPATNTIILHHGLSRRKMMPPLKNISAGSTPRLLNRKNTINKNGGLVECVLVDRPVISGLEEQDSLVQRAEDEIPIVTDEPELDVDRDNDLNKFSNNLKIHHKDFEEKMLTRELPGLFSHQQLCDVLLVCQDGEMFSSGLLLASISSYLGDLLQSVPRIDSYRTLILPEFFSLPLLTLLNRIIFREIDVDSLTLEELGNLLSLAQTLQCTQIIQFCESRILMLSSAMRLDLHDSAADTSVEAGNLEEEEEEEVEPTASLQHSILLFGRGSEEPDVKKAGVTNTTDTTTTSKRKKKSTVQSSLSSLRIDKSQLNNDYLDANGIVRLDSRDEMALHYCLICDAKFKKYKQAITHYKSAHLLEAMLTCDVCDTLFVDMYNCVKHKYEQHGGFDRNLQCYICQEVFYSRFRLGSHFKENHREFYGEYICKVCHMKFPAENYLRIHTAEQHAEQSNSCNICGKTFSGKRYLTMHIKSAHQLGGKFDFQCKFCAHNFAGKKELMFHTVKSHNQPKPVGMFEECNFCDKYFKTKAELKQHLGRKHKPIDTIMKSE